MFFGLNKPYDKLELVYALWTSVLILEMMILIWFTGRIRKKTQTIHSEEDHMWMDDKNLPLYPCGGGHPDVDRIRVAHYHDLNMVMTFALIIPLWLHTSPKYQTASILLRLFPIMKIMQTIAFTIVKELNFIFLLISDVICYSILLYMTVNSILFYCM
ncbi:uncharacterized protein [Chelonus insularis]|uniref:uncharacterized protein n=1 Tax=Chelonus insularis TaxID=460826 RepID=UPI00158BEE13|nr:uncharacterized protein LOC118070157 [Chelonus insularis]